MANSQQMANAIRALAMDAVQQANSGHPGAPMGMADMAVALWSRHLRHNPANPQWADRDRFVLSNGHGSMLLYALLHPHGLRPAHRGAEELPPAAQQDGRPPRIRHHPRRRDDHRPAGPGHHQRRGLRAGREAAGPRVQPQERRRGPHHRGPPHLRVPRRRLPDGGHQPGGDLAGRRLEAGQADRALRRQRHLHRRPGRALVRGRHAGPLPRQRLERDRTGRWPRRGGRGRRGAERQDQHRQAHPDRLQDRHRQGFAQPRRHLQGPRRAAGRRRDHP